MAKEEAEKLLEKLDALVGVGMLDSSESDSTLEVELKLALHSEMLSVSSDDILSFFLSRKFILSWISIADLLGRRIDNSITDSFLVILDRTRLSSSAVQRTMVLPELVLCSGILAARFVFGSFTGVYSASLRSVNLLALVTFFNCPDLRRRHLN